MLKKIVLSSLLIVSGIYAKLSDAQKMVGIHNLNPTIKIECMYATYYNFTGQPLYPFEFYNKAYLLKEVADQINLIQKELEQYGLGLLIWDAFRPLEGQQQLWNACPDERFVFPPTKGGKHTRGTTIDLTLIDLKTGNPLDMGTGFDVFIDRSASDCATLSETALANRKLLQSIMAKYGFTAIKNEWWHFDYENVFDYPVLDVTFEELELLG